MAYSASWSPSPSSCLTGTSPWPRLAAPPVRALEAGPRLRHRALDPGPATTDRGGPGRLRVNLLTEDNLPSYYRALLTTFGHDGAWNTWSHRWTAEEDRHAIVLRDYLLVTRDIDPDALERGRMATLQQGWTPNKTALGLMAYAAFQELATPDLPPQHRPLLRRPGGRQDHAAGGRR